MKTLLAALLLMASSLVMQGTVELHADEDDSRDSYIYEERIAEHDDPVELQQEQDEKFYEEDVRESDLYEERVDVDEERLELYQENDKNIDDESEDSVNDLSNEEEPPYYLEDEKNIDDRG